MSNVRLPAVKTETEFLPFAGGLDVVTPALLVKPGACRAAQNYEIDINGGYTGIRGYERTDGRVKPSDASYALLDVILTGSVSAGDLLTTTDQSATGIVIAIANDYLVLTKLFGTFQAGNILVGVTVVGTCRGAQRVDGAPTAKLQAQYKALAANVYRTDILAVPGNGSLLGLHVYQDTLYAFRNNAFDTGVDMYRATSNGWFKVELGFTVPFKNGSTEITEGQIVVGATTGARAFVNRVALQSGTWGGGTAKGQLITSSLPGTFSNEAINLNGTLAATVDGTSSAIAFTNPGGRFECINTNFGGGVQTQRMYGCDGKNYGFEFDGAVMVPIRTGMVNDAPEHLCAHKNQLFFSFLGSVQNSGIGKPYAWTAVTGAGEIAMGDAVTGFARQPGSTLGGALAIFTRNSLSILYGSSVNDWNLVTYKEEAGAYPYTIRRVGLTIMFDDRGITSLDTTQHFGNFEDATLSHQVQTWLKDKRSKAVESCIVRDKNQYRLFFSDGYALYATLQNNVQGATVAGFMPVLFPNVVRCAVSAELSDGSEVIYFGSDNGMVYQMDSGTSFDGVEIEAYIDLAFANLKSPRMEKQFRKAVFEVSGDGYAEFDSTYELGYGSTDIAQPGNETNVINFTPAQWDSFTWDAFIWDGQNLSPSERGMDGTAENVSLKIRSQSDYFSPIRFSGALVDFTPRRRKR